MIGGFLEYVKSFGYRVCVCVCVCGCESRLILNEEEGVGFDSLLILRVFVFKRKVVVRSVRLGVERKAKEQTGFDLLQA